VYRGIKKHYLPALRLKIAETLSHTLLSLLNLIRDRPDVLIVFNPANSPLCVLPRLQRVPFAINLAGLEWRRTKWSLAGRLYLYLACRLSTIITPYRIADSRGIQRFYREHWHRDSYFATYGAYRVHSTAPSTISEYNLRPRGYFLIVARMEPENNTRLIVDAFTNSATEQQLIIVGSTPYKSRYFDALRATRDERIRFLGGVYDQPKLNELLCNCTAYVHGHMVGGTNPSLLQALGASACVLYLDDVNGFNREVVGDAGISFHDRDDLTNRFTALSAHPETAESFRHLAPARIAQHYTWDLVADQYEALCNQMIQSHHPSTRKDALPSGSVP
jgi:glycosyltransferase involved in cell wall biosynthesis